MLGDGNVVGGRRFDPVPGLSGFAAIAGVKNLVATAILFILMITSSMKRGLLLTLIMMM